MSKYFIRIGPAAGLSVPKGGVFSGNHEYLEMKTHVDVHIFQSEQSNEASQANQR